MPQDDANVSRLAELMIAQHGVGAARAAVEQLNARIDRGDWSGRDRWACVVRAIHEELGTTSSTDYPVPPLYALSQSAATSKTS